MHDPLILYRIKIMTRAHKTCTLMLITVIMSTSLFFLFVYPLQQKIDTENTKYASLLQQKDSLEKQTRSHQALINTHEAKDTNHFSSANQCAHFLTGACIRHHLTCHDIATEAVSIKKDNCKCFISANINGSFKQVNELLNHIKEQNAIKIKSLVIKQTSRGTQALCRLRFSLIQEGISL